MFFCSSLRDSCVPFTQRLPNVYPIFCLFADARQCQLFFFSFFEMSVPVKRRRCSVSCCKPSDRDAECISSHAVPDNLRATWLEAIGCSSSDTFFRVCSRHFAPDAFKTRTKVTGRLQLRRGAIPTLFLPTATAASAASLVSDSVKLRHNSLLRYDRASSITLSLFSNCVVNRCNAAN